MRRDPTASLSPPLEDVRIVSRQVAMAVAMEARRAGLAEQTSREELERRIERTMWEPRYQHLTRGSTSELNR